MVDNVYPVASQDGLVKSEMAKLTNYVHLLPEKADRIGEYIETRLARDLGRRRVSFVEVSVAAMDILVTSCPPQTPNLFVESFLKMVQRLLECSEVELQILATQSFVKFANITEHTPSYHRRYDFFVAKFAELCHSSHADADTRKRLRRAGLFGLQGVVKKMVSDVLVENIWTEPHMNKIIPSLLYNMHPDDMADHSDECVADCGGEEPGPESSVLLSDSADSATLSQLASDTLRQLISSAPFSHIHCFMKPVLRHLDDHQLCSPNQFAIQVCSTIMLSIPQSYEVIKLLMSHLAEKKSAAAPIRTGIADLLSAVVIIAAGDCIGPSVLEIINSLLTRLSESVSSRSSSEETAFQEALINTLGEFANNMPDYQKIEIMMFIVGKVPQPQFGSSVSRDHHPGLVTVADSCKRRSSSDLDLDHLLRCMLLRSLLKVSTKYKSVSLETTFPLSFLDPLMRMCLSPEPGIRLLVQQILHTLLDRHDNASKLQQLSVNHQDLHLTTHPCSRQDAAFMRGSGCELLLCLLECLQLPSCRSQHVTAVSCTLSLLWLEAGGSDVLPDLLRLLLDIQDLAISVEVGDSHRANLHILCISLSQLIASTCCIPALYQYITQLVSERRERAEYMLPPLADHREVSGGQLELMSADSPLLLSQTQLTTILSSHSVNCTRLDTPFNTMMPSSASLWQKRHSILQDSDRDINIAVDVDSLSSSVGALKSKPPAEEVGFDALRALVMAPSATARQTEEESRKRVADACSTLPLHVLSERNNAGVDVLCAKLGQIFSAPDSPSGAEPRSSTVDVERSSYIAPSMSQIDFPDQFVY